MCEDSDYVSPVAVLGTIARALEEIKLELQHLQADSRGLGQRSWQRANCSGCGTLTCWQPGRIDTARRADDGNIYCWACDPDPGEDLRGLPDDQRDLELEL